MSPRTKDKVKNNTAKQSASEKQMSNQNAKQEN